MAGQVRNAEEEGAFRERRERNELFEQITCSQHGYLPSEGRGCWFDPSRARQQNQGLTSSSSLALRCLQICCCIFAALLLQTSTV